MSHQQIAIDAILAAVKNEPGIRAIFLKGSFGRGTADEYSDIDFYCLVDSAKLDSFLQHRRAILERYRPILFWAEVNFVAPQIVTVFDDGTHVDLYTVTLENLPTTESIKILFDPENLLANYVQSALSITWDTVIHRFDSFSFTVLEIEAALKRGSLIWAAHLVHYLPGEIALLYRFIHDPDSARLSLKNIDRILDTPLRDRMWHAAAAPPLESTRLYIDIMRDIANQYPPEQRAAFNWAFFDFMAHRIQSLASDLHFRDN